MLYAIGKLSIGILLLPIQGTVRDLVSHFETHMLKTQFWGTSEALAEIDRILYTRFLPNHTYAWPLPIQDWHQSKMAANQDGCANPRWPPTTICRAHQKAAALNDSLAGNESANRKSKDSMQKPCDYFQRSHWLLPYMDLFISINFLSGPSYQQEGVLCVLIR